MKNILHIVTSPRGEESVSIKLGNAIVNNIAETFPGSTATELNLAANPIPHITGEQIKALRTPQDLQTDEDKALAKSSDDAVAQLQDTDIIVISIPMYNFGIPSNLKSWLDLVLRAGKTFTYTANGPQGLVTGKKVYLALATGGIYSEGPAAAMDFIVPYLKATLGFIGITDITVSRAEGIAIPALQAQALDKAIEAFAV